MGAGRHVVVAAGSGFGKTTLLASWAATRAAGWVTLDAEDADLDQVLAYLVAACEAMLPGFATGAHALLPRAREREAAQAALATLVADLEEQAAAPCVLVLDDYHLAASPTLDALLERLFKVLPAAVRLVVGTTTEPAIGLAGLRAARRVELLGEADLRFDDAELQALRPGLDAGAVAALRAATGAWPAAMGLPPDLLDAYMEERFLRDRPPEVRAALGVLAQVERFDAAMFADLVEAPFDAAWRERLVAPRLVIALGEGQHAVPEPLRGLLRRQLLTELPREERRRLLARVGEAHWHAGQHAVALRYWADAGEAALAATRLEALAPAWLEEGRLEALASALAALGPEGERPALLAADAELRRRWGDLERARERFGRAREACAAAGDRPGAARAALGLAMVAAASGQEAAAREVLAAARTDLPADDRVAADVANVEGGLALLGGSVEEAIAAYEGSLALARRRADGFAAARAIHNLGVCHTRLGAFERALRCYDEAQAEARPDGTPTVWMTPVNRALVLCYLGRLEEARAAAAAALELVRRFQLGREEGYALRTLGFAHARLGDAEAAAACYEAAAWVARRMQDALGLALSRNYASELALEQGELAAALAAGDEVAAALGGAEGFVRVPECGHVRARVLLAAGRAAEAMPLFDALEARARALDHRPMLADLARARQGAPAPAPVAAPAVAPELAIHCFGRFRVLRAGAEVGEREWQSAKAKALVAFLLHAREGAPKADLSEVLYPNEAATDNTIYMTLLRARKALEPDLAKGAPSRYILRAEGRYMFNRQVPFQLDTLLFEAALRRARRTAGAEAAAAYDEALALYAGDFAPELDQDWAIAYRQRLRDEALAAASARLALGADPAAELALVHRALEIDPLSEEFNRELILRYVEAREPHRARAHYELVERRFREALDMPPPEDLTALVAGL